MKGIKKNPGTGTFGEQLASEKVRMLGKPTEQVQECGFQILFPKRRDSVPRGPEYPGHFCRVEISGKSRMGSLIHGFLRNEIVF
jgi:hypothetical protein